MQFILRPVQRRSHADALQEPKHYTELVSDLNTKGTNIWQEIEIKNLDSSV